MRAIVFPHPEPFASARVRPVFLPFAGCPDACVYCDQRLQTATAPASPGALLDRLRADLAALAAARAEPMELAFYGGTFTRLPARHLDGFLATAREWKERGLVTRLRCSTRPDAVDAGLLAHLRASGMDMVELGVQSFDPATLEASRRGYGPETAMRACALVRAAGLDLGVQILPGLPGMARRAFLADVAATVACEPQAVRIYPCQVVAGTQLAAMFERGEYAPWPLGRVLELASLAVLRFWKHGIRVIRIGLAPEAAFQAQVLAGPAHPALGARVRARALLHLVRARMASLNGAARGLRIPRRTQGEFWGHRGELSRAYARLGLTHANVHPWDQSFFLLY
ncbi:MAG: radical SAM protein [Desulfovibrionaceae bacterium]|jgi:histone acetyltransferase (RNA polymerase elongator complex component)|nr:radical SAM protein [Desulfovibrionaceae bacterium]